MMKRGSIRVSNNLTVFPEPPIEFRYGQRLEDPHDGLSLFGPYDTDAPSHPRNITYGVIGTEEGIAAFERWSQKINGPILPEEGLDKTLWPPFPGFDAAFASKWPEKPARRFVIDRDEVSKASCHRDPNTRASEVVDKYLEGMSILRKHDEIFGVIVCIVPDEVWKNCRPKSRVKSAMGFSPSKKHIKNYLRGQKTLFEPWSSIESGTPTGWTTDKYGFSVDFRRQIKARALKYDTPIQIIRESTLGLDIGDHISRGMTGPSDRAWNLSTALYYKAGGKPWRLAAAREGVCYIGIAFKRTDFEEKGKTACCAAQMFLDSGDGIVFLGDEGPWFSPDNKQFHLTRDAAKNLLGGILKTYGELEGKELKEIFLHSHSSIDKEEFKGYTEACPDDVKIVGVRVRLERKGLKLYRKGSMPILRGTFLRWDDDRGYLWGSGFKPRLGTYDGWEVPTPLRIDIQYGNATIEQVSKDIFALTKLNYNACRLGDSEPVTIKFSDAVGEILVSNPTVNERNPKFKFYI